MSFVPDLAPDSIRSETYFVGRCEQADYVEEEREIQQGDRAGEKFTSRSVVIRWAQLDAFDDEGKNRERQSFFNYPASGSVHPNAPLGQFAYACRDAGTPIKKGNTTEERRQHLQDALVENIYVVLAKSETARGSDRARTYTYPVKLVGRGATYDVEAANEVLDAARGALAPDEDEVPAPAPEAAPEADDWMGKVPEVLETIVDLPKKTAILRMGQLAVKGKWSPSLMVFASTGRMLTAMETAGLITTDKDGKITLVEE